MAKKVHRRLGKRVTLHVEPLEARIAPAVITHGQSYQFTDSDGDEIRVDFFGPGSAEILDATDGNPTNDDIDRILLDNTRDNSRLIVTELAPGDGGDVITAGRIDFVAANRSRMGRIILQDAGGQYATIEATSVNGGRLRTLEVTCNTVDNCFFESTGTYVYSIQIDVQNTMLDSQIQVAGSGQELMINGDVENCSIEYGRHVKTVLITGNLSDGTAIGLHRKVDTLRITGNVDDSDVYVAHTVGTFAIVGDVTDTNIELGSNVTRRISIEGSYTTSNAEFFDIHIAGTCNTFTITDDLSGDADALTREVIMEGTCRTFTVGRQVFDSNIDLGRNVMTFSVAADFDNSTLSVGCNARLIRVAGTVLFESRIEIMGGARRIEIGGDLDDSTLFTGRNAYLVVIGNDIIGDGDPSTVEVDIGGRAYDIRVQGNIEDAVVWMTNRLRALQVGGNVQDSTIHVNARADNIIIGGALIDTGPAGLNGGIEVVGPLRLLGIGGGISVGTPVPTPPDPAVPFPDDAIIDVALKLTRLIVDLDIGSIGGVDVPLIRVRALGRADVNGVIYGKIQVLGHLGDIFTAGTDATVGAPVWRPYTGRFLFNDAAGVPTDGWVDYVTWVGSTVS